MKWRIVTKVLCCDPRRTLAVDISYQKWLSSKGLGEILKVDINAQRYLESYT